MFRWLANWELRADLDKLRSELNSQKGRLDRVEGNYNHIRGKLYNPGNFSDNGATPKSKKSPGQKVFPQITMEEKQRILEFLSGCNASERDNLIAKLKLAGYDVEAWLDPEHGEK